MASRITLKAKIEAMLEEDFGRRILPFDSLAAQTSAVLALERRQAGKAIAQADVQIAAIAWLRGASLATHNVPDFEFCGVEMINPWQVGCALR